MNEPAGDELAPLETAVETPPPPASATSVADPVVPAPPSDPESVDVGGKAMVPLASLLAERRGRQEAEQRTKEADAIRAWYAEKRPLVEWLEKNPGLQKPTEPTPAAPVDDPEAKEVAELFDFYTADGKPDLARGRKHLALVNKKAQDAAKSAVEPHERQSLEQQATANYQLMRAVKMPDGSPIRQDVVDAIWLETMKEPGGLKSLADRRTVAALTTMAIGAQTLATQRASVPPVVPKPPLVTENPGGSRVTNPAPVSKLEQAVIKSRNADPAAWQQAGAGFVKGRANALEDE